jgi:hypothetical protein
MNLERERQFATGPPGAGAREGFGSKAVNQQPADPAGGQPGNGGAIVLSYGAAVAPQI